MNHRTAEKEYSIHRQKPAEQHKSIEEEKDDFGRVQQGKRKYRKVCWRELSARIGLEPVVYRGSKEIEFGEYLKYAVRRISHIDAEVSKIKDIHDPES